MDSNHCKFTPSEMNVKVGNKVGGGSETEFFLVLA